MGARELLDDLAAAGLNVAADGDRLVIQPASKLTDAMRVALHDAKPSVLALLAAKQPPDAHFKPEPAAVAWADQGGARNLELRARLRWWRWAESEAESMAEQLATRDREHDERVSCVECRHYRPGRCGNYRLAGLTTADVSLDLARLLQRCTGFRAVQSA